MHIIVDTNVIDIVFNIDHKNFNNFEPVYKCIVDCRGIMYYGGSKFKKELGTKLDIKYNKLFKELRNVGRLRELNEVKVNNCEKKLKKIEPCKNFDDEHIIACIILSQCEVVVTNDKRSDKYIKDEKKQFYMSRSMKPKIYRYRNQHERLLKNCFES
jgi:predicted nucleic acid-binding protein